MVDKLDTPTIFYITLMGLWKGSCMKSIFRYKIPLDHPVLPFSRNNEAFENRCWGGLGAGDCSFSSLSSQQMPDTAIRSSPLRAFSILVYSCGHWNIFLNKVAISSTLFHASSTQEIFIGFGPKRNRAPRTDLFWEVMIFTSGCVYSDGEISPEHMPQHPQSRSKIAFPMRQFRTLFPHLSSPPPPWALP